MTLTDEELYEGFSKEKIERYKKEVDEKYDPELVKTSRERMGKMSRREWHEIKDEGDAITRELAALMDKASPDSKEVQAIIKRHHAWIEKFYPANAETYKGLGITYKKNPEFREYYDKFSPGLAEFLCKAMEFYTDSQLG